MSTTLKGAINGGVTFSATPATQRQWIFIAKGSSPWYNPNDGYDSWSDASKVTKTDESVSGQATVTCSGVTNMSSMFYNCSSLTSLDLSNFDTSNVTNMSSMFSNCSSLTSLDLSNFDTSNVTDMDTMFYNCSSLTSLDLSNFDTSNVTNMRYMFSNCSSLTSIKGIIDMKSCTSYSSMFNNCTKLTGVKIKNPPSDFDGGGLSSSQYTIVS